MKTLIGIPTYNEDLNILEIYRKIRKIDKKSDILFIDDNSNDGTIIKIKKIKLKDKKIYLKIRPKKLGIGSAHKDIIIYSYKRKYSLLITFIIIKFYAHLYFFDLKFYPLFRYKNL